MFQALGRRLLFSYLGLTVAIWGTSTLAVYQFLSYNLYQKLDQEIVNLANAAAHNLIAMKAETKAIDSMIPRIVDDDDGDLDIPWQDLRENRQGVEWFNAHGQLLGKAGKHFSQMSVTTNFQIVQQQKIRSITIPVYSHHLIAGKKQLQGYVRVSESTEELEEELENLLWGFEWGGLIVIVLGSMGGWWLTRQSLKPIQQSFQQLKQFTADASHELRSPLTAVKTSVEVIMNHPERVHPADVKTGV